MHVYTHACRYRLQSIREGINRVVPVVHQAQMDVNTEITKLGNQPDIDSPTPNSLTITVSAVWVSTTSMDGSGNVVAITVSTLVYAFLLLIVFPIMLAVNLDQLGDDASTAPTHTANTTTPHYNLASPNPEQVLRTMCWQRSGDPPPVPWAAVFAPFLLTTLYALIMVVAQLSDWAKINIVSKRELDRCQSGTQRLQSVHEKAQACVRAVMIAEASPDPRVAITVDAVVGDYTEERDQRVTRTCYTRDKRAAELAASISNEYFKLLPDPIAILVDAFMVIIGVCAAMAYAVTELCAQDRMGPQESQYLVVIFAALCVFTDVGAAVLMYKNLGASCVRSFNPCTCHNYGYEPDCPCIDEHQCPCRVYVVFFVVLAQQILLFLELFTFFHQVTFFVVFSPLLIMICIMIFMECAAHLPNCEHFEDVCRNCVSTLLVMALIPSIVLLIFKMDNLFDIGTALLIGSAFPKFSWVVVMIPTWVTLLILSIFGVIGVCVGACRDDD